MPTTEPKIVGEVINVGDIYIAKVEDKPTEYKPGTPRRLAPTASIARDTTVNTKPRYYSGKAYFVDTAEGETKLTVVIPGLSVKDRAELLGKPYDPAKGLLYDDGNAAAPYYAMGYKLERPDDEVEYAWFLKGKFSLPKQEGETKTENLNEKPLTMEYGAVVTMCEFDLPNDKKSGVKCVEADTSDDKFTADMAKAWFNAVQMPGAAQPPEGGGG
ncbi:MAG: hypothetical protein FWE69_03840 [Clostridiales bacterium]|nr:hypothetical protein [Clostridiales bacterium]